MYATASHQHPPSPPIITVERVFHEMEALNAAQSVVEGQGDVAETRLLCRTYLARLEADSTEEKVTEAALQRILGRPVTTDLPLPAKRPWEDHIADLVAMAWLAWASGQKLRAEAILFSLRTKRRSDQGVFTGETGALHLLTLYFWCEAVEHLVREDLPGARRFFRRALDLGSQFGTASHPMISWAYASSFFA